MSHPRHPDAAVASWLQALSEDGNTALTRLLFGEIWLGGYAMAELAQAVPQFLPLELYENLDIALLNFLSTQFKGAPRPESVSAKGYAQALVDAFALLQAMDLPRTQNWCRTNAVALWRWLKTQAVSISRDPRPVFLRALALHQPNRDLLSFWMDFCRQGEETIAPMALFGLRRLPADDEGHAETGIPAALIEGLLAYAQALGRFDKNNLRYRNQWLKEIDFLTAVYPTTQKGWEAAFRPIVVRRNSVEARWNTFSPTIKEWFQTRYPGALKPAPASTVALYAPFWDDAIKPHLSEYDSHPTPARQNIEKTLQKHRHYARETGDGYFLVRAFCRLGDWLMKPNARTQRPRDPAWAQELGEAAAEWGPGNPIPWGLIGRALDAQGQWRRARAVFWYARRRFPQNAHSHNQLAHALLMRGETALAETMYRETVRRFQDDAVARCDLALALRIGGKLEEAVAVLRQAQTDGFAEDQVIAANLVGALIDFGDATGTQAALHHAERVSDGNPHQQKDLADLRQRLAALQEGRPLPQKKTHPAAEVDGNADAYFAGIDCSAQPALGEATTWRAAHAWASAETALAGVVGEEGARRIESGLIVVGKQGWEAGRNYFARCAPNYPGDGYLQAHHQRARARCGDPADWNGLSRFADLHYLLRLEEGHFSRLPAELDHDNKELDETGQQSRWLYQAFANESLRDLIEDDYLYARQLAL